MDAGAALDAVLRSLEALWRAIGPLAGPLLGVALGWWLARRAARGDEQRGWAIEFRRILGRLARAEREYSALAEAGPGLIRERAVPMTDEDLTITAWRAYLRIADPVEDDFFLYLEVLPFLTNDQRIRAVQAWFRARVNPAQVDTGEVTAALDSLRDVLADVTVAVDRGIGLRTQRRQAAERGTRRGFAPRWRGRAE